MSSVAVPNVSEGRDAAAIARLAEAVRRAGAVVADVHSDAVHNRSVLTAVADPPVLTAAMAALAVAATELDLTRHDGVHPRLGVLDVCPFVVDSLPLEEVVSAARSAGAAIWRDARLPVYLYGYAATRPECRDLPDLRRGGLHRLVERSETDLPPDFGGPPVDPARGVVCVGARAVLVAFNVWLRCDVATAGRVASRVRGPAVRALGLDAGGGLAQVSMNLVEPEAVGVDRAYELVARLAAEAGAAVHGTELVGVPPERYMPAPDAEAARRLIGPGRSLERALAGA